MNVTLVSDPSKKLYYQAVVYNNALKAHWQECVWVVVSTVLPPVLLGQHSYNLYHAQHRVDWLAFVDADEFFFLTNPRDTHIGSVLRDYDEYSALGVNWIMFSSSDYVSRPLGTCYMLFMRYLGVTPHNNPLHPHKVVCVPTITSVYLSNTKSIGTLKQ